MLDTQAYDGGLPCLNPNCKSHGSPHPNCRCYFGGETRKAKGGEIESFCSQARDHKKECEYYKEGGQVRDPVLDRVAGASALRSAIESGLFHGNDEIGNSLLHKDSGDHRAAISSALSHMGGAKLLGANKESDSSNKLKEIEGSKLKGRAEKFLSRLGYGLDPSEIKPDKIKPHIHKIVNKSLSDKEYGHIGPSILSILSSGNVEHLHGGLDHANSVHRGSNRIDDRVKDLFDDTSKNHPLLGSESHYEKIKNHIEKGTQDKQIESSVNSNVFSDGEKTEKSFLDGMDAVSTHWPNHAALIGEARGRVHNYLNSIRPLPPVGKLPYDVEPDSSVKKRSYDTAVRLAQDPLTILDRVKDSSLTPEDLIHFRNLYPEIHDEISKRMTLKIAQNQLDKKMPPYSLRQSMSLFLGHPLDSTFLPQNIMGAQPKPAMPPSLISGNRKKGSMQHMGKIDTMYQTPEQKREIRRSPGAER